LIIFVILLCLLALTVAAAFVDFDHWIGVRVLSISLAIAMAIAIAKAVLIMLYFMHVKFNPHRTVIAFAGAAFIWLGILFALTYSDYLTRNHPGDLNFKGEPRVLWHAR
jgi:cytochrome c oxidase subunit 4